MASLESFAPMRTCMVLLPLLLAACSDGDAGQSPAAGPGGNGGDGSGGSDARPEPAEALFPTARALYERAVAPSCAGSAGSCHTGWAQPELSSFDAFVATAGAFCQVGAGDPKVIVDGCERPGDRLVFADSVERSILRVTVPDGAPRAPREVTVFLDGPAGDVRTVSRVRAPVVHGQDELRDELRGIAITRLEAASSLRLDLSRAAEDVARAFDLRRWPRVGTDVIVGDANGNGKRASVELRQLVPGKPEQSFLYLRLLNEELGARMPLVESGWTPEATRALRCFVHGLPEGWQPDTLIADEPIDYDGCPRDPGYTDPGDADYQAVQKIFTQRCASSGCHGGDQAASGLDLRPSAFTQGAVIGRPSRQLPERALIRPGAPAESYLYCKIDPSCSERAPNTQPMPLGGALGEAERATIRRWIEAGAKLD